MGEAVVEGVPPVQAMEQDRNEPQGSAPRRLRDAAPAPAPETDDVMRWVAAGIVAAAALLGLVVLVAMVFYALQPPGWLQTVLGVVMVAGTVFFAWLLAAALRRDEAERSARRR